MLFARLAPTLLIFNEKRKLLVLFGSRLLCALLAEVIQLVGIGGWFGRAGIAKACRVDCDVIYRRKTCREFVFG